jgi:hypothetical protein
MNAENRTRFNLREAREADIPALAALHVKTFDETHRGGRPGGPSYELRERQWREAFERLDGSWFCYVIEDDRSELVGFAKGTPHDGRYRDTLANLTRFTSSSESNVKVSGGSFSARLRSGSWNVA